MLQENRYSVSDEGRPAGDHLVEYDAERVEVAPRSGLLAERLLGRHVREGAHHRPFLREPWTIDCHREAEVAELGESLAREPDVTRLHVSVDDSVSVGTLKGLADLIDDAQRPAEAKPVIRAFFEQLREGAAGDVLADDVRLPLLLGHVMDGDDRRMLAEPRHRLGLAADAGDTTLVERFGLQDRDGDVSTEARVARQIDTLLRAFSQEAPDLVAAGAERRRCEVR